MTTSSTSATLQHILQLANTLDAHDKAALVNELVKNAGLSVVLFDRLSSTISLQIDGLDDAGKADVMHAIAESLRQRACNQSR